MLLVKSPQNRILFLFSFAMVAILHGYVLQKVNIVHQVISVKPQRKVSSIINLQHVAIKKYEPKKEILPEPLEAVVEEVVIPPKIIKHKAIKKAVKKKNKKRIKNNQIVKKIIKKKKLTKSRKKVRKNTKTTSKAHRSAPKQKAIKNAYLAKIRRIIEQHKRYPKGAKRMKQQGTAYIKFSISTDGTVHHIGLAKKCPFTKLNKAALKILQNIGKFDPIPKTIGKSHLSLTIPIAYKILN